MKRLIIIAMVVSVVVVAFSVLALQGHEASAARKMQSDFFGRWEAIDVLDGSYLKMSISNRFRVRIADDWAIQCPEPMEAATITTVGIELPDPWNLILLGEVRCKSSHVKWQESIWFEYIIGSDVLVDSNGNVWTRM